MSDCVAVTPRVKPRERCVLHAVDLSDCVGHALRSVALELAFNFKPLDRQKTAGAGSVISDGRNDGVDQCGFYDAFYGVKAC